MGRPKKFNDDRMGIIISALKNGSTRKDAAKGAGVTYRTFANWIEQGEKASEGDEFFHFFHAVEKAEAECANKMAKTLIQAASKDWRAAETWLKRRRRSEWGDSLDVRRLDDDTIMRLLAGQEDDEGL